MQITRSKFNKISVLLTTALFVALFFFGSNVIVKPQTAYAWDENNPANYITPNSIYLDHTGNLTIDWSRGVGSHLQGDPGGYLTMSINGTSTDGTALIAQSNGQQGYCRQNPETFSGASQDTYGNQSDFSQIYDANAGQAVSTEGITTITPIYINMWGDQPYINDGVFCYASGNTYYGSIGPLYINFSAEQLTPIMLQPFNLETMSDFPHWLVDLSVNFSPATGTLILHYGDVDANTFTNEDSISYDVECDGGCDESVEVPKSDVLSYPQQQTSTEWWVYPEVQNTSTGLDITGGIITFFINPNAPQYAPVPSSTFIIGPTLGAASTTASCEFTTEDFLDDPVGNIEQSVCNSFSYLFLPSDDEQADLYERFQAQWTQISNRVPFGYVGIIQTAFSNFQEGTNTSTLMTTTTYAALSSVLDPLKAGISFLLILMFGFFLFHFARTIVL
jgi:hypothetical protein